MRKGVNMVRRAQKVTVIQTVKNGEKLKGKGNQRKNAKVLRGG